MLKNSQNIMQKYIFKDGLCFIPSSSRIDGSLRKEIKVRPGFTPQEEFQKYNPPQKKYSLNNVAFLLIFCADIQLVKEVVLRPGKQYRLKEDRRR